MGVFNKIQDGFTLGVTPPVVNGIEDWLYVFNKGDFTLTFDPNNPLIVTGIIPVTPISGPGPYLYKFTGTNNSFTTSSKSKVTQVGPRYTEELDWNIAGNSTNVKMMAMAAGYGRVQAIAVNNFKSGDSAIELFGAVCGLISREATRDSTDETVQGGWKMKLGPPDKLDEPYPPRAVLIPPVSGSATYATTLAAIEALVFPNV